MSEHEKGYIPPMTGEEVFAMFGDRRLLTLEEQLGRLDEQMKNLSAKLLEDQSDPESDPDETERLHTELNVVREMLKEHQRIIRLSQKEFGKKRGPVTLH
ncbi:MAG: hypothetical protein AAB664_01320 [Patescibacteria group bacterium]